MATPFAYPYDHVAPAPQGFLAPGQERTPSYGPSSLFRGAAITVSAHPFRVTGPTTTGASELEVTSVRSKRSGEDWYLFVTIKNLGPDPANVHVVLGGITP
jgi:hypothetical protein